MFKFRGFRASLDFITGKQRHESHVSSPISIGGAYKINRDEFSENDYTYNPGPPKRIHPSMKQLPNTTEANKYMFIIILILLSTAAVRLLYPIPGNDHAYNPPKRLHPSMVQLPNTTQANQTMKSKSTSNLTDSTTIEPVQVIRSSWDVSQTSRASKSLAREQKKLHKQQLAEQKKQEKIAAKERQRQEKLAKERIKQDNNIAQGRQSNVRIKCRKKRNAPQPPQNESTNNNQVATNQMHNNNQRLQNNTQQSRNNQRRPTAYSTNTLESSISRSTGPPPYGEYPDINIDDADTGNIRFGKPVDYYSSWDLISQHREQMGKPATPAPVAPRRKKELQYKVGNLQIGTREDISDA